MKILAVCVCVLALASGLYAASLRDAPLSRKETKPARLGDIWSNCGKSGDVVTINGVKITPDPPVKNSKLTGNANITTSSTITGGKVEIEIKWGFVTVVSEDSNVCDVLKDAGLACPLAAGTYSVSESASLPSEVPSGHYTGSVKGTGSDGKELFCINLDFHL